MIYFIQEAENSAAPIKIGFTAGKVKDRLASLQTGYPAKLGVLASLDGDSAKEFALHRKWAPLHLHGEWFRADEALLVYISEIKEMEPPEVVPEPPRPAPQAVEAATAASTPWRAFLGGLKEGDRFGLLTFIGAAITSEPHGRGAHVSLVLICDCGKETIIAGSATPASAGYGRGYTHELLNLFERRTTSCVDRSDCPAVAAAREKQAKENERLRTEAKDSHDRQLRQVLERARVVASEKKA